MVKFIMCPMSLASKGTWAPFIISSPKLSPFGEEGRLVSILTTIFNVRERGLRRMVLKEYLIKLKDFLKEDATWEGEQIL